MASILSSSAATTATKTASKPLSYNSLILLFPGGRPQWYASHAAALAASERSRIEITTQASCLVDLKAERAPEHDFRYELIKSPSGVPEEYYNNWKKWTTYLGSLEGKEGVLEFSRKHRNWLEMLEKEYREVEPVWEEFWDLHDKIELAKGSAIEDNDNDGENAEVAEILARMKNTVLKNAEEKNGSGDASDREYGQVKDAGASISPTLLTASDEEMQSVLSVLNAHNTKRAFLHERILQGNASANMLAFFGEGMPDWIDWGNMGSATK